MRWMMLLVTLFTFPAGFLVHWPEDRRGTLTVAMCMKKWVKILRKGDSALIWSNYLACTEVLGNSHQALKVVWIIFPRGLFRNFREFAIQYPTRRKILLGSVCTWLQHHAKFSNAIALFCNERPLFQWEIFLYPLKFAELSSFDSPTITGSFTVFQVCRKL